MARRVKKDTTSTTDAMLETVRREFMQFVDATQAYRALAEKCRDYRDGIQWTDEERETLRKRKQPCITDNKIQDKCDTLLGLEKQARTDPKAFPRTPAHNEGAEAATDALRFVADDSDYHRAVRKCAADNIIVEGVGVGQVIVEKRKGSFPRVRMEHIFWERAYWDPYSLRLDFSDKQYCGYFTWMDVDQAKRMFPGKEGILDACEHGESEGDSNRSHDDKPRFFVTKGGRKRVQVFNHYRITDGVWHEGIWVRGGFLEPMKPATYLDEFGEPTCCMELQALYRNANGEPYGAVQRYLDLQDEHNKRRSKMLHLLNSKRIVTQQGNIDDISALRSEVHKPDGVIEVKGDIAQFRVEDNLNEAQGQWQLLQQTDAALAATGPNAALTGQSGSISGRAKELDQMSGSVAVTPVFEALDSWESRMYRQAWSRVKQYWNQEIWVRVTDDDKKWKFVAINQPMTQGDMIAMQLKNDPRPPEEKAALLQQIAQDPAMQQPAIGPDGKPIIKNRPAEIDVDIVIDRSPDTPILQQEQFAILSEIAKARPEIPFQVLVKASQLRSEIKDEITDTLKENAGVPPQVQQAMQEIEARGQQVEQAQKAVEAQADKVRQAEMKLMDEAAKLDAKRADIELASANVKTQEAKLQALEAKLDAKIAELEAARETVMNVAEAERATLTAQNAEQKAVDSESVLEKVSSLLAEHMQSIEKRMSTSQASTKRGRKFKFEYDANGEVAGMTEQ